MHVNLRRSLSLALLASVAAAHGPAHAAMDKAACIAANEDAQRLRDAHRLLAARERYLACSANACPAVLRKDCIEQAEALATQIPSIVPRLTDSHGSDVTSARVSIDGKLVASKLDGTAIALDPGTYDVRFESENAPAVTVKIVLLAGERNRVVAASLGADAKGQALMLVSSTPSGAEVFIDGAYAGKSPVEKAVVEGEHTVRVELPGHEANVTTVTMKAGERRSVSLPLRENAPSIFASPWFWVGTGVVVVGAGIGAYFLWSAEKSPDSGTIPPGQVPVPLLRF